MNGIISYLMILKEKRTNLCGTCELPYYGNFTNHIWVVVGLRCKISRPGENECLSGCGLSDLNFSAFNEFSGHSLRQWHKSLSSLWTMLFVFSKLQVGSISHRCAESLRNRSGDCAILRGGHSVNIQWFICETLGTYNYTFNYVEGVVVGTTARSCL